MELITKATVFAARAHDGARRKGSGMPYILHPMEAACIVAAMTRRSELIAAALLHDVLEDTAVTYEELRAEFGEKIADIVQMETEDKSKSWQERKGRTIEQLPLRDNSVKMVTLGDKLSNMRATYFDYKIIGDQIWQRFHVTDKKLHAWYYQGLLRGFESLRGLDAFAEFEDLVLKVFGDDESGGAWGKTEKL